MLQPAAVQTRSATSGATCIAGVVRLPRRGRALAETLLSRPGWEPLIGEEIRLRVRGRDYRLTPLARGEGRSVFLAEPVGPARGTGPPEWQVRQAIGSRMAERAPGSVIVCSDAAGAREVWSWRRTSPVAPPIQVEEHRAGGLADRLPVPWCDGVAREPPELDAQTIAGAEEVAAVLLARLRARSRGPSVPVRRQGESAGAALLRVISTSDHPERVRSCWRELGRLSVLDPDCGGGEWLLGCLEALATLALACLERMQAWLEWEGERTGGKGARGFPDFRRLLARRDELRSEGGRERLAFETVLLRCLHGVAATEQQACSCRERLAARVPSRSRTAARVSEALLDVRVGIVPSTWQSRQTPAGRREHRGEGRQALQVAAARAIDLGRAEGELTRLRLALGGALEEVAEGKQEIRIRRLRLRAEFGTRRGEGDAAHRLHAWLEYPQIARRGGFALVRAEPAAR